jgi:hypothetical protein
LTGTELSAKAGWRVQRTALSLDLGKETPCLFKGGRSETVVITRQMPTPAKT